MEKILSLILVLITLTGFSQRKQEIRSDMWWFHDGDSIKLQLSEKTDTNVIYSNEVLMLDVDRVVIDTLKADVYIGVSTVTGNNTEIGVIDGSGNIAGDDDLTFDGSNLTLGGDLLFQNDAAHDVGSITNKADSIYADHGIFNTNVGIGTDDPDKELHLSNSDSVTIRLESSSTNIADGTEFGSIEWETLDASNPGVAGRIVGVAEGTVGRMSMSFETGFGGTTVEAIHIDSDQNIGIGTDNPSVILEVFADGDGNIAKLFGANADGVRLTLGADDSQTKAFIFAWDEDDGGSPDFAKLFLGSTDAANIVIDAANNRVGIGTDSPGEKLEVNGNVEGDTAFFDVFTNHSDMVISESGSDVTFNADSTDIPNYLSVGNIAIDSITSDLIPSDNDTYGIGTSSFIFNSGWFSILDLGTLRAKASSLTITTKSNGNISLNPAGTGVIYMGADFIPSPTNSHDIGDPSKIVNLYYGDTVHANVFYDGKEVAALVINQTSQSIWSNTTNTAAVLEDGGTGNIILGQEAGNDLTTGDNNILFGRQAGDKLVGASDNIFIGDQAGSLTSSGTKNIFIGSEAGSNTNTNGNVIIGDDAGGGGAGSNSVLIGYMAADWNPQGNNTIIGYNANNGAITSEDNVLIGYNVLGDDPDPTGNSKYNVYLGSSVGYDNKNGYANVMLGFEAGKSSGTDADTNIFIGYQAGYNEHGDNKLYIANSSTATPLIYGDFSTNALTVNGSLTVTGVINHSGGICYVSTPGTQTIGTGGTFERLNEGAIAYTADELVDFTHDDGRLTYTGTTTRHFIIHATVAIQSGETAQVVNLRVAKGSASIVGSNMPITFTVQTVDRSSPLLWVTTLATNEYIEIYGTSNTNGDLFDVLTLVLSVTEH